jgi:hypothetical protein
MCVVIKLQYGSLRLSRDTQMVAVQKAIDCAMHVVHHHRKYTYLDIPSITGASQQSPKAYVYGMYSPNEPQELADPKG